MSCAFHLRCTWPCPIQARINEEVRDRQHTLVAQSRLKYAAKKKPKRPVNMRQRGLLAVPFGRKVAHG